MLKKWKVCILWWGCLLVAAPAYAAIVYVPDEGFTLGDQMRGGELVTMAGSSVSWSFAFQDVLGEWNVRSRTSTDPHELVVDSSSLGARLDSGAHIGPGADLDWEGATVRQQPIFLADLEGEGNFFDTEGFLGVRMFVDEPDPHYGWLRIGHSAEDSALTVHDWAWNDTPGEPILAGQIPEPATYAKLFGIGVLVFVVVRRTFRGRHGGKP